LRRFGALIVDGLLLSILVVVTVLALGLVGDRIVGLFGGPLNTMFIGPIGSPMFMLLTNPLVGFWVLGPVWFLGYYVLFEGTTGQTPGKRLFGLLVIGRDGSRCTVRAAAIRTVLRAVDGAALYLVGAGIAVLTNGDRRLGDMAAGTQVVHTRR
jgi:uncharacterized RDD family membrane protein YckC